MLGANNYVFLCVSDVLTIILPFYQGRLFQTYNTGRPGLQMKNEALSIDRR